MPKKSALLAGLLLILLGAVPLCALGESRLMVVSDLHYLAKELYEGSELFISVMRNGDGKLPQCGEELLQCLVRQVNIEQPDALLVTGDLSFNGEKASHEALSRWFGEIEKAGVPVWVIPGNHDINCPSPVGFAENGWYTVENATEADFAALYADFLLPPPAENAGFSYAVKISDTLWAAMTDAAYYRDRAQAFGLFTASHGEWLEKVLEEAGRAGAQVITASHHSLVPHTEFAKESFLMFGHEAMQALLRRYGVRLHLSGHLHIQHIARMDGLFDAALGAFCAYPHRYAIVTVRDDGSMDYEAKQLSGQLLPEGFQEMSKAWFEGVTRDKAAAALSAVEATAEERSAMADYAARFNLAYFSGAYQSDDPSWKQDPAFALWQRHKENAFAKYLLWVMEERTEDNLFLHIPPE